MSELEIWKDIKGYEGYYQISNIGNVKSLTRENIDTLGRKRTRKGKIQKKYIRRNYWAVWLNKDCKATPFSIHRLVCIHFIFNKNNKKHVNHLNGNKLDNRSVNLEWCTPRENTIHAIENGLIKFNCGSKSRNVKLTEEQVFFILKSGLTQQELADKFNVSRSNISCIQTGKSWSKFSKTIRTHINKVKGI